MVWFSFDEHVFRHPWEKVVEAAIRKYPNPETPNVTSTDVCERTIDQDGKLCSTKIISSVWRNSYMDFMSRISGFELTKTVHGIEFSIIDPKNKTYELKSRNYNLMDYICIDERLVYSAHPVDPELTKLKQEWRITCKNISFKSFLENAMGTTMKSMSVRGREGIEYVIKQLRDEVERLATPAFEEMQNIASKTLEEFSNLPQNLGDIGKRWEENLHDELNEFIKSGPNLINQEAVQN